MPEHSQRTHDVPHDVLAAEEFGVPAPDPQLQVEPVHDVLAAEEFGVPAPDPRLQVEPVHDVLAAEEFEMPAPDPELHSGYQRYIALPVDPEDPDGAAPAHDVLAAEEFALPAPAPHAVPPGFVPPRESPSWRGRILTATGLAGLALAVKVLTGRRRG